MKDILLCIFAACLFWASPAPAEDLPGTPLPWKEVERERLLPGPDTRGFLQVVIVPASDQSKAVRGDLLATVMQAAMYYHEKTGIPVIHIGLICRETKDVSTVLWLAQASYIPDGNGYGGKFTGQVGRWDLLHARQRGFTDNELEYMRLAPVVAAEDLGRHIENLDRQQLDVLLSERLGVPPGSINPEANEWEPVTIKE